jgi:phenylacetate-CoA ligase
MTDLPSDFTATSLAREKVEQQRWQLHQRFHGLDRFDRLLANEFLDPKQQENLQGRALSMMINHAVTQVPYYAKLFTDRGLTGAEILSVNDLAVLPILSKIELRRNSAELTAAVLPPSQQPGGVTQSSGTTGQPVRVHQTRQSMAMFCQLKQRELRWFRFDPRATLAVIRLPSQLPFTQERQPLSLGQTLNLPAWPLVGSFFQTGPACCFSVFNQIDRQAEWLDRLRPEYLMSYPETFEHLSFAFQNRPQPDYSRGLLAISEQLTAGMRRRISTTFGAPIQQNYGLNEIGIVASRCPEGGRYHVHSEHCLVEIVDDDGKPCGPGETGRILVTTLTNSAMPLIRYDTGDLAETTDGPCPCGRSMPTFGEVKGRYSRIAFLPENTLRYVGAIRQALEEMAPEISANLRLFQIHQFRDQSFELRLVAPGGLPPGFAARINTAWRAELAGVDFPLRLLEIDHISRGPGGKFQDFTSDFFPPPDGDE